MRRDRRASKRRSIERQEARRNPIRRLTPDQAERWVDEQVTDLASAKVALKRMARALAALMADDEGD